MKEIKFIHVSDLHLNLRDVDYSISDVDTKQDKAIKIFDDIIERCFAEDIDMLFISGDFFDNDDYPEDMQHHIINQFESIPSTRIYIAPGSHDSIENMYIYKYNLLPSNVFVFTQSELEKVAYNEFINIIGANNKYELTQKDLLEVTCSEEEKNNILILHFPISYNNTDNYEKKIEEILEINHLNYFGYGHIHNFTGFSAIKNCIVACPGSPYKIEDNAYNKGYIVGTINGNVLDAYYEIIEK